GGPAALLRRRCPPESPPAVLAVAGERRMNPVIGRQIAGTDPPSRVVNVQRIQRSALTPRALLQLAPVSGKVAAHMPDADSAIIHGQCLHPGLIVAESAHHCTGGPTSTALRISAYAPFPPRHRRRCMEC